MRRVVLPLLLFALGSISQAAGPLVLKLEMKDGVLTPQRLEVPARTPFRLEIRNVGKTAAEFESKPLKQEKILPPGASLVVEMKGLAAGEYTFVDEFREKLPTGQGVLVAK